MSTSLAKSNNQPSIEGLERVLVEGDLGGLTGPQRIQYYERVCASVGLNPLTQPFEYLKLQGKTVLYAKRAATDQLRRIHNVSVNVVSREKMDGIYVVTARATMPDGRTDESIGAVPVEGLKGEAYANALMKAESKAKRRVTLAICGLSLLDELEVESVQINARTTQKRQPTAKTLDDVAGVAESRVEREEESPFEPVTDTVYDQDGVVVDTAPPYTIEQHMLCLAQCSADALGPWFEELQAFGLSQADKKKPWEAFIAKCAEFEVDAKSFVKKGK
jgi:hypothetical protein